MLDEAEISTGGTTFTASVGFNEPQTLAFSDGVVDTGYRIEYDDPRMAGLKLRDGVVVKGVAYRVSQPPQKDRLGVTQVAELEKV